MGLFEVRHWDASSTSDESGHRSVGGHIHLSPTAGDITEAPALLLLKGTIRFF